MTHGRDLLAQQLERYVHPQLGFSIDLAPGLELTEDVEGVALVAREGVDVDGFRANLTVVVERLDPGTGLEAYVDGSLAYQGPTLSEWRLLDRAPAALGASAAVRTLGLYVYDGLGLALEQWRAVVDDHGWVVSATCAALTYPYTTDVLTLSAESLRPATRASS